MSVAWSANFNEAIGFTMDAVLSRRSAGTTELRVGAAATDWAIDDKTTLYAGFYGESTHSPEVTIQDGTLYTLQTIAHLNFVTGKEVELNYLTIEGEIWRLEPGQDLAQQLSDADIPGLVERATVK